MAAIKYKVALTEAERSRLNEVSQRGKASVRTVKRALSLLKADQGLRDREIADVLLVNPATVARARKRFGNRCSPVRLPITHPSIQSCWFTSPGLPGRGHSPIRAPPAAGNHHHSLRRRVFGQDRRAVHEHLEGRLQQRVSEPPYQR